MVNVFTIPFSVPTYERIAQTKPFMTGIENNFKSKNPKNRMTTMKKIAKKGIKND